MGNTVPQPVDTTTSEAPPDVDAMEKDVDGEVDENEADEEEAPETRWFDQYKSLVSQVVKATLALGLVAYVLAAFIIDFSRATAIFVLTIGFLLYQLYWYLISTNAESVDAAENAVIDFFNKTDTDRKYQMGLIAGLVGIMAIVMAATVRDGRNLISLFGLIVILCLSWLSSWKPFQVKLRPVLGGIFIQFIFGYLVIRTEWGFDAIEFTADVFVTLLGYTLAGSGFVFAWLTDGSLFGRPFQLADESTYNLGPPFFFNVLPSVIFFSSLMSVGYYIRLLPWLVKKLGYFLAIILGTSASESLSAAGNIFVGQTEAPLLVRPFMPEMTESELHAIMTGGFATIAGSVLGVYISFGIDPVALIAASVMSAPAALAISKLVYPETEESPTAVGKKGAYDIPPSSDANIVHAASNGALFGTTLLLNIAGNLIAFLALVEMIDQLLIYLGDRIDVELNFNTICEIIFWPVAWLIGIDVDDCDEIAITLGLKVIVNEFVAYERLAFSFRSQISERSFYIASFALCGFSNFGSIGIQLGGLTPLAPNQGEKLAKLVFSAMIAGNTACLMTACIAGIFFESD